MKFKFAMTGLVSGTILLAGCGVRGKPTPPETPPLLGRGEPSYSRATESVTLPVKKKKTTDAMGKDKSESEP